MTAIMLRSFFSLLFIICLITLLIPLSAIDASSGWQAHPLPGAGNLNLLDIAVSPDYEQDGTLCVLGWDNGFSLWRGQDGLWAEILKSGSGIDSLDRVMLTPADSLLVYGIQGGIPAIWHSADSGVTFAVHNTPYTVDQWACASDGTLFISGYDGTHALICYTSDYGASYSSAVNAGNQPLYSIALSPDYAQDGTLLTGTISGRIWRSQDRGTSFQEITSPLAGNASLAFDPDYANNRRVYAAGDAPGSGLYSLNPATEEWRRLDSGLAAGAMLGSVAAAPGGLVYAGNYQAANSASLNGGMVRCFEDASSCGVVLDGLPEGATLWRLWRTGWRLWAMDTTHNQLWYYDDSLSRPVALKSPADGAMRIGLPSGGKINGIALEWEALTSAAGYRWQVSTSSNFNDIPSGLQGITAGTTNSLPGLSPFTLYYWRVRVESPLCSPWSAVRFFITTPYELPAPCLESPLNGASDVALKPLFMWSAVNGAGSYELNVSAQPDFSSLALQKSTTGHVWQATANLGYGANYYWRVRATAPAPGVWSEVWSFNTIADTLDSPALESPVSGAAQVAVKPLFVWSAVSGAAAYELAVSAQPDFASLALFKTLSARSWQADVKLEYEDGYYWRVRALKSGVRSDWSAVGYFTTEPVPVASSPIQALPPVPTVPGVNTAPGGTFTVPATITVTEPVTAVPATTIIAAQTPDRVYYVLIAAGIVVILLLAVVLLLTARRRSPYG